MTPGLHAAAPRPQGSGPTLAADRCYRAALMDLHDHLAADHRRLEALITALIAAAPSDAATTVGDQEAEFESALIAHFEAEEKHLFPLLTREFPEEVTALREEHETIRRQLGALAAPGAEGWRGAAAQRLAATLQRHARREDAMLYDLVNDSATSARYQDLIAYLETTYAQLRAAEPGR